ncbi:WecB/TagA/CpsF family glycosyltransferase [Zobellia barbeyronii]|nr:WecB/TagA/CpsF family glycosyltransferase [Zobellia barbeyronii]
MSKYKSVECMGYPIFNDSLEELKYEDKVLVSTINQYSYCIAEEDIEFKNALMQSDVLLADGVGIVAASSFLNNRDITKIAGADIHDFLLKKLNKEGGSCFYLGASESTLKKIEIRIKAQYPNIKIGTFSPPFKAKFDESESQAMIDAVNAMKPDVLFVGMTAPKQEKWAFDNKKHLEVGIICSIGAVFDFYAGTINRPAKVWINLGLEWLGRLVKEPRRMWKRYIYYGAVFSWYLIKEKVKAIFKRKNK